MVTCPPEIGNLSSAISIDVANNILTGQLPPEIGNLTQLRGLFLGSNDFTGPIPEEIGQITQLEALSVASNRLDGAIPNSIVNLENLSNIQTDFGNNCLRVFDPTTLDFVNAIDPDWYIAQSACAPTPPPTEPGASVPGAIFAETSSDGLLNFFAECFEGECILVASIGPDELNTDGSPQVFREDAPSGWYVNVTYDATGGVYRAEGVRLQ